MNIKMILNILGKALLIEAVMLLFPLFVSIVASENNYFGYLITILVLLVIGLPSFFLKPKNTSIHAKEGFVTVALVWMLFSLFGALPMRLCSNGVIVNYVDAFFETVSGFTTTGATVVAEVELLPKSLLFWRSFTHWLGGMGILVFVLAIIPRYNEGIIHIFKAESPGPQVGKLVSKMRHTARILYAIYFALTFVEFALLVFGDMDPFDSLLHAFSTAGTGGFGTRSDSLASFSAYSETVIAVFMFIFSINVNVFYLILLRDFAKAFKNEELLTFAGIVAVSTLAITINILPTVNGDFLQALRHSFFQVTSISSTTGFSSVDFNVWPVFSKLILMFLMIVGACAGSTGGGLKISRLIILFKSGFADIKKLTHPRSVVSIKHDGRPLDDDTVHNVRTFLILWMGIVVTTTLLISIEGYGSITGNLSATLACIGNVGPGFETVGPLSNYGGFSAFSKIILSLTMLIGRLEIFPIIALFKPSTWKKHG